MRIIIFVLSVVMKTAAPDRAPRSGSITEIIRQVICPAVHQRGPEVENTHNRLCIFQNRKTAQQNFEIYEMKNQKTGL
jgi:hypothetical protein